MKQSPLQTASASLVVDCLPYANSALFNASEEGHILGFGLLLPSVNPENWFWSVGAVLCPMGCKILTSIAFYIVSFFSVLSSIHKFKNMVSMATRDHIYTIW